MIKCCKKVSFINPQKPSDSSTLSAQSGHHIQGHSFYENIYKSPPHLFLAIINKYGIPIMQLVWLYQALLD